MCKYFIFRLIIENEHLIGFMNNQIGFYSISLKIKNIAITFLTNDGIINFKYPS